MTDEMNETESADTFGKAVAIDWWGGKFDDDCECDCDVEADIDELNLE